MSENINLTSKIRLKTNPISYNSMSLIRDKKSSKLFIAHTKGIHIYDSFSQTFEDVKMAEENSGVLTCLTLSDDLIFFCYGMKVLACASNGRIIYQSDTYLAVDKIEAVHVYGYQLWLIAGNMVNEFLMGGVTLSNKQSRITPPPAQKIQDVNSQIFDVKINYSLLIKLEAEKAFVLLLKNNNQIQTVDKKDGNVFATESPPTYAYLYPSHQNNNKVLVGTMSGEILYLQVERKKIKKLWSIKQNSKGRINCMVEVNNAFIVFRDECFEMWNINREFLGREDINEKIVSAHYLPDQQSFFYGTTSGQVVEMFNYQKMMKLSKQRNEAADRSKLINQILELTKLKAQLKSKADLLGLNNEAKSGKNLKISTNLCLDYINLCYCLQISCQKQILKLIVKGDMVLLQSSERITFEGKQNENNRVYILRTEDRKSFNVKFKYEERFHNNQKLTLTIFNDLEGKLIATNTTLDLKFLSLHQKVDSKLYDKKNPNTNMLVITGEFKHFLMATWLSSIFNQFGSPSLEAEYIEMCYESLVTKNRIFVQYRDKECCIFSEAPNPLNIIKKTIIQKCKQKHLSLNYDSKANIVGISNLLKKMSPKIKELQLNKREYDLLPGLLQLQNQSISSDLKQILGRSETIKSKFADNTRQYQQIKASIKDLFVNYRLLNNKQVSNFQLQELTRCLQKFDAQKILKLIGE